MVSLDLIFAKNKIDYYHLQREKSVLKSTEIGETSTVLNQLVNTCFV